MSFEGEITQCCEDVNSSFSCRNIVVSSRHSFGSVLVRKWRRFEFRKPSSLVKEDISTLCPFGKQQVVKQSMPSMIIVVQKIVDHTTTVSCLPVAAKFILSRKLIVKMWKWAGRIFRSSSDYLRKFRKYSKLRRVYLQLHRTQRYSELLFHAIFQKFPVTHKYIRNGVRIP